MIIANDGHGNEAGVSFQFKGYGTITDMRAEIVTDFIYLYWDPYGDYAEGELEYRIYMDGELFDTRTDTFISFDGLEPSITYSLMVIAFYEGAIIAFGDYEATTLER